MNCSLCTVCLIFLATPCPRADLLVDVRNLPLWDFFWWPRCWFTSSESRRWSTRFWPSWCYTRSKSRRELSCARRQVWPCGALFFASAAASAFPSQISLLSSPHIPTHCTFPLYYCHPLTSYSWTLTLLDEAIGGHHLVLCKSMTSKRVSSRIRWYHYNSLAFSDHKSSAVLTSSSSKLTKQKWSQISSRHSKLPQLQLLSKCVWRW